MSPSVILLFVFFLYFSSQPKFRRYIVRDGQYLSRDWTSLINAFFISLVVCSHGLLLFSSRICDFHVERWSALFVGQFGQLMVAPFFFFSGYGIMLSLSERIGYEKLLIFPRFVGLSLNYILTVVVYFAVHSFMQGAIVWRNLLGGLHSYEVLGNPTWFILMTLLIYVFTYVAYKIVREGNPIKFVFLLTFLLGLSIIFLGEVKPIHWLNTILCFPAGMFYYIEGEKIEKYLCISKIPSIVYALLLLLIGKMIYDADLYPNVLTENIGSILFACGVTWVAGSFSWSFPSRFLIWLGGSGMFAVYMLHLLPIRIFMRNGWNDGFPYLVWFLVFICAGCLVFFAHRVYGKINIFLKNFVK